MNMVEPARVHSSLRVFRALRAPLTGCVLMWTASLQEHGPLSYLECALRCAVSIVLSVGSGVEEWTDLAVANTAKDPGRDAKSFKPGYS